MSRHNATSSYMHKIVRERSDEFVLCWTVDFYYPGTRGRFPRRFVRDTNRAGALRFTKKWNIPMPEDP